MRSGTLRALAFVALIVTGCAPFQASIDRPSEPPASPGGAAPDERPQPTPSPQKAPASRPEEGAANQAWTYAAIRGAVASVGRDGAVVIRVGVGRKSVDFSVPAASPKAAELARLIGKTVEVEGKMELGRGGQRILMATDVTEVP